jgi:hypothetical protein
MKKAISLCLLFLALTSCSAPPTEEVIEPSPTPSITPVIPVAKTSAPPQELAAGTQIAVTDTPTPSTTPAPATPTETPSFSTTDRGWKLMESEDLGIQFQFPGLSEQVWYESNLTVPIDGYEGVFMTWNTIPENSGWTYSFAGCVSEDFSAGRETWPTDSIRWINDGQKTYIEYPGDRQIEVTPLAFVSHPFGAEGLIFDPNGSFWSYARIHPEAVDRVAILNFPIGYHPQLKCIAFYVYDETPLDLIEDIILSVEFSGN